MKKNVFFLILLAFSTLCAAQNILVVNDVATEEIILISPMGQLIKSLKGIDIDNEMWKNPVTEPLICAFDKTTKKTGYLSRTTGEWAIPPQYKNVSEYRSFSEGFVALVTKEEGDEKPTLSAVIDKMGKIILPFCKWTVSDFHDGLAVVENEDSNFGAIDQTGKLVIPFSKGKLEDFKGGLAKKNTGDNKSNSPEGGLWGYINKTGKIVVKQEWEELRDFSEGLAAVSFKAENPKYGFIDKTGKIVIQPTWGEVWDGFSEGLICVSLQSKNPKWGFIDKMGKLVIPYKYDSGGLFAGGFAAVGVSIGGTKVEKSELVVDGADEIYAMTYIDKTGKQMTKISFNVGLSFSEGMAAVMVIKEDDTKIGYIDSTFKLVIPIVHNKVPTRGAFYNYYYFNDGLCPTAEGYIDKKGKLVVAYPNTDYAELYENGRIVLPIYNQKRDKYRTTLMDKTGKILWQSVENKSN